MRRYAAYLLLLSFLKASTNSACAQQPSEVAPTGTLIFVPSDIYNPAAAMPQADPKAKAAADELFAAAAASAQAGEVSLTLRQASRVLAIDPNHEPARRLLGYRRVGKHWAGKYASFMLERGNEWDPKFGWIKSADAPRFRAGERPWGASWITPAEDAERHARIDRGWTIRTDHIHVTTNVDRAAAADLALRLETLYHVWTQLFGEFAETPAELKVRLDGKQATGFKRQPFRVIYHRNRDEYNAALIRRQPQIAMTLGIYFDAQRQSHFFAGAGQDPGTIAHEAVHQFFFESVPKPPRHLGGVANAWALEGVACYFETLVEQKTTGGAPGKVFTLGSAEAGRLPAARHRRVVDNYYVPLAELSQLGMIDLQQRSDIARLYSQSAGLASFFIDGSGGAYRKPFAELLRLIYTGRDQADTLSQLTGKSYDELDREYQAFMQSLPATGVVAQ